MLDLVWVSCVVLVIWLFSVLVWDLVFRVLICMLVVLDFLVVYCGGCADGWLVGFVVWVLLVVFVVWLILYFWVLVCNLVFVAS